MSDGGATQGTGRAAPPSGGSTAAAAPSAGFMARFAAHHGALLITFTAAMFVSALLLFMVQPMFAKMVLPRLGGSPAVWSVAMCFFQVTLLAGYAYAHALSKLQRFEARAMIHVGGLAVATLALPLGVAAGWERAPEEGLSLWVFGLFAVSIGLPFLMLSANAPTLQAWFSRTGHPHAADPYFLYGASNVGSLLALLAYPVLLEPQLSLSDQSAYWTLGFMALIAMVALCATLGVFAPAATGAATAAAETQAPRAEAPTWGRRLSWIGLAFAPSALLVAVTSHISTDVSSAPFLWVIPLALFLLTFVITFQQRPILPHSWMLAAQPVAAAAMLLLLILEPTPHWGLSLVGHLLGFFILAMVCHGALVASRPSAERLTEFYLYMSLGGALGGVFTGLIAPQLFSTVLEFPLLILAALLARPGLRSLTFDRALIWVAAGAALVALAFTIKVASAGGDFSGLIWVPFAGVALFAAAAFARRASRLIRGVSVATAVLVAGIIFTADDSQQESHRGFFGVTKIELTADGGHRLMLHGTTLHGAQRIEDGVLNTEPLSYYHSGSPLADAIEAARSKGPVERIGVVGLGTGSLACRRLPAEEWTFFEIDPIVVNLAKDPDYFTFMSACAPEAEVVIGDARITLADQPDGAFDLLILDAFSSDAIPTHLLTAEAIDGYFEKIAPGGMLAMHISNRNVDLGPVIAALAQERDKAALHRWSNGAAEVSETFKADARVAALARREADFGDLGGRPGWSPLPPSDWRIWRDDYANVLQAIWAGFDMEPPAREIETADIP
ncbi:MAG: fused MFS/spermidine synthase [Pseudomonadota bacterium]